MKRHATKRAIGLLSDRGGRSRFVARSREHAQLGTFLRELGVELGPVPEDALEAVREAWPRGRPSPDHTRLVHHVPRGGPPEGPLRDRARSAGA
jgi:hypothetical protein